MKCWRFTSLSTPHGTLGTAFGGQIGCGMRLLSTPHGTLGTALEIEGQVKVGKVLSTPHGTLGTTGQL